MCVYKVYTVFIYVNSHYPVCMSVDPVCISVVFIRISLVPVCFPLVYVCISSRMHSFSSLFSHLVHVCIALAPECCSSYRHPFNSRNHFQCCRVQSFRTDIPLINFNVLFYSDLPLIPRKWPCVSPAWASLSSFITKGNFFPHGLFFMFPWASLLFPWPAL